MSIIITTEIFKERVKNLVGDEYTVLEDYKGTKTKIDFFHEKCKQKFKVAPNRFSNGSRCPFCAREKTNKNIIKYSFQKVDFNIIKEFFENEGYEIIGTYINTNKPVEILHSACGYKYQTSYVNFRAGHRCPKCMNRLKKSTEQFKDEVFSLYKDEYSVIGEYINTESTIKIKHNICGNIYEPIARNFIRKGSHCPYCSNNKKKTDFAPLTDEKFKENFFKIYSENEYEILEKYKGYNKKILFKHNICNNKFYKSPAKLIDRLHGCPYCKGSYGEQLIEKTLSKSALVYEREKRFNECKDINLLPFDFFINNKVCLEYDGEQHYFPIFGDTKIDKQKNLKKTKEHDKIKNKFCKDNNIFLIRIPFWEIRRLDEILKSLENYLLSIKINKKSFNEWKKSLNIISFKQYKENKKRKTF